MQYRWHVLPIWWFEPHVRIYKRSNRLHASSSLILEMGPHQQQLEGVCPNSVFGTPQSQYINGGSLCCSLDHSSDLMVPAEQNRAPGIGKGWQ